MDHTQIKNLDVLDAISLEQEDSQPGLIIYGGDTLNKVVASMQVENSTQIGDIFRSFSPVDRPIHIQIGNSEIELSRIELRQTEQGQYFVLIPSPYIPQLCFN